MGLVMYPRVIKTEFQYRTYLEEIENLAVSDPDPASEEGAKLELLAVLVEAYERERSQLPVPTPIDAILFRMEEQGLQQKDLLPYIGSKSRVSEVLSGKRGLSLSMIRALSEGLGIPAKSLVTAPQSDKAVEEETDWSKFPLKEMSKRGWFGDSEDLEGQSLVSAVKNFFEQIGGQGIGRAYCRRTMHLGGEVSTDFYALNAWIARILVRSRDHRANTKPFQPIEVPESYLRELAQLSWSEKGPLLAQEFLRLSGIIMVVEKHLPRTKLDGAAILDVDGTPVIGLTLRYDRIDNFWFTLLHEVAHVLCHLHSKQEAFIDNTEHDPDGEKNEVEANNLAQEALIPRAVWRRSDAYRSKKLDAILSLANELRIHPAIIAGRIRKETSNYRKFSKLINREKVSILFAKGEMSS